MRWLLGLAALVVACGDDPHLGPVDAPETDAPEIDAPATDGPPIDVPGWVGDGPQPPECFTNAECYPDEFCRFAIPSYCRQGFQPARCMPRPTSCPAPDPGARPVCGCDGVAYDTECDAFAGGTSVGPGGCGDQGARYACGDTFCEKGAEYCAELRYNEDFARREWECRPMPVSWFNPCSHLMDMTCPGTGHAVPGGEPETCTTGEPGTVFYMCYVVWT